MEDLVINGDRYNYARNTSLTHSLSMIKHTNEFLLIGMLPFLFLNESTFNDVVGCRSSIRPGT